ncbi:MAG: FtsX-like permease family protein [Prevotellaceae bacterium]|jgi:ABC-type lipoprotein release transport system permease subunit|nr:FtsX-like permease family protein [Prevotellaceae bacterium]
MIKFAWRNIWRNKVRSGVIISAIAIGLFSGTFTFSFITGWLVGTINNDIETQCSHIQIHDKTFLTNYDINACFKRDEVEEKIKQFCSEDAANHVSTKTAYRLNLTGMLASPYNAIGVTAKAVWEDEEKMVTTVWKYIPDTLGTFLDNDTRMAIVISKKIAEKLKVKLGSKIVFTFQDVIGDMQSIAFRVCGIYNIPTIQTLNVFIRYRDVFDYTNLPFGSVHEAAVRFADIETCSMAFPQLKNIFPDMDVQDWNELNPALSWYFAYTDIMGIFILSIFLFALSFGIINTMLMAVLERTRELGILMAIGMSKGKIFNMIMLETLLLTLVGGLVGTLIGSIIAIPLMKTGIDLTPFMGDYFEDYGFASIVTPVLHAKMLLQIATLVIFAGIVSAIYPARKALKLKPLEAIREV